MRENCSAQACPETTDAARAIANQYGLTGPLADTLVTRSHLGTQYLQYIFAGEQMKAELADLSREIDAPARQVDPFMLFGCGLNTPRHDAEYVAKLKACLAAAGQP